VRRLTAPVLLPCDLACSVVRDGVLDIADDGRILWCGPRAQAPSAPDAEVHELTGILLPGLVNAHCHTPMTVLRGMGGDLPLMRWLQEVMWPAEGRMNASDVRAGMLLGCVEMLRAGVTTSVEMYFYTDAVAEAALDVGSRLVLTPGIIAVPGWDRLGSWQQMTAEVSARIDANGLRYGPGERIELGYGPHGAYTLPAEALPAVAAAARERGALMHMHLAETTVEDAEQRARFGSVPRMLEQLGVLDAERPIRLLAAHGVHLDDADIALFAQHQVTVAHCPGSNAKLAAGTARVPALRRAGVPLALGTDGPAASDDLDLWSVARLAGRLARLGSGDAAELTAADLLLLATRHGAAALGRDDLGALEPGRWADVVHVTTDDPAFLHLDDDARLLSNLVWAGGARLVRDVWVAGDQVIADTEPTRVDRAAAQSSARAVAARL
jgi:5-methylthioadenosine/S-adenosylhomocysteine deaminase